MEQDELKKDTAPEKKKTSWIKKIIKFILYLFVGFLILNILVFLILSLPIVQSKITSLASDELSKLLKTEVRIDAVRYKLFNYVSIENLYVADQKNDTLIFAGTIDVGIKPLDYLFYKQISIDKAIINDIFLNAYAQDSLTAFNYQFLIDEFSTSDTLSTDTSSSTLNLVIEDFKISNGRIAYKILDKIDTLLTFNPYNLYITDLNLDLTVRSIDTEHLDIEIHGLTAKEQSGLTISNIRGKIKSEKSKFYTEDLYISTPNSHLSPKVLSYDTKYSEFAIQLEDATLDPVDFIALSPTLKYLDTKIYPVLSASGILPTIQISQFNVKYGEHLILQSEGFISSYEELDKSFFELKINQLTLTPDEIAVFAKLGDETFVQPDILKTLGTINLNAQLKGELSNFTLTAMLASNPGNISLEATGSSDTTFTYFHVQSKLSTVGFKLRSLIGSEMLGKITLGIDLDVKQEGMDNLYLKAKGNIKSLDLMKGQVKDLPFYVYMDPKKMGLNLDADLNFGKIKTDFEITKADYPDIDLDFHVKDFHIDEFYTYEKWNNPILDFDLKGIVRSYNIDDLNATITLSNFSIVDSTFSYKPAPIELKAWKEKDKTQNITLTSSVIDASIRGKYQFSTISEELSGMMNYYFSNIFPQKPRWTKNSNDFTFKLSVYNTQELSEVLDLPFTIIKPLELKGQVNTIDKELALHAKLPLANMDSLKVKNMSLDIRTTDSVFQTKLYSDIYWSDTKYQVGMDIKGYDNAMKTDIKLKSDTSNINLNGLISFTTQFFRNSAKEVVADFFVTPTNIEIEQFIVNILPAEIVNINNKISINNLGFGINGKEYFDIDGVISNDRSDSLYVRFTNAQIADILAGFNVKDIYAEIDGDIKISNTLASPELFTDNLRIKDIVVYGDTLGSITTKSTWNNENKLIDVLSILNKNKQDIIKLNGNVDPVNEVIDFDLNIDKFNLGWIYPFANEYLSKLEGSISSQLSIKGPMTNPETTGFFGFNNAVIGVDYTNVTYYISDTIAITPEHIGLRDLQLKDSEGDIARVNAQLTHDRFTDMKFNLSMQAKDLMVLNTQTRTDSLFYGKLYVSGNININGDKSGMKMNMQLQNAKKSNLNISMPQVSEASEYSNIVYINVPPDKLKDDPNTGPKAASLPVNMGIGITLNPSIRFSVIIDPDTGDKMEVSGNGNVNFQYNMENSNMSLFGDYTMEDGVVKLNLKNLYKIEFKIQSGSQLNFIGDPMNTKFNVVAYKRVRADLKTLDPTFAQEFSNTRVLVDCLLGISGNMNKMDLTYNIKLVDAADDQINLLNSLINTSEAKIRQFAYLVTVGSFYPTQGGSGANFTDGMWTNLASSALSAGLTAVLGNVLGNNWQIGADISDSDKSLNASTSFFDNRLKVTANVGYRDNSTVNGETSRDSFIGDFDLEYLLSPSWALKAYSHTNNQFYRQGNTIQGIGITYTKDASTFSELFETSAKRRSQRDRDWRIRRANLRLKGLLTDTIARDSMRVDTIHIPGLFNDSIK